MQRKKSGKYASYHASVEITTNASPRSCTALCFDWPRRRKWPEQLRHVQIRSRISVCFVDVANRPHLLAPRIAIRHDPSLDRDGMDHDEFGVKVGRAGSDLVMAVEESVEDHAQSRLTAVSCTIAIPASREFRAVESKGFGASARIPGVPSRIVRWQRQRNLKGIKFWTQLKYSPEAVSLRKTKYKSRIRLSCSTQLA